MYLLKIFASTCMLTIVASCTKVSTEIASNQGDNYQTMRRDLNTKIPKLIKKQDVASLVVLVIDGQETVYAKGFGYADKENNITASPEIAYRSGSISKLFTATALMQLQEQGKIDIDKPLSTYLPDFSIKSPYGLQGITLRRMMTHHSGLPSDFEKGFSSYAANRTLLSDLRQEYVAFKPDTVHAYSNLGYGLLGRVIEQVSGMSYEDYLHKHIFAPLGMTNAFVGFNDSPTMARAYEKGKRQKPVEIRDRAAGDISLSANDLALFAKAMLMHANEGSSKPIKMLSRDSVSQMWRAQNTHVSLDSGLDMGLGWILSYPTENLETMEHLVWHNGSTIYFSSSLLMNTRENVAVIVLSNSLEADSELTDNIAKNTLLAAMASKSGYQPISYKPNSIVVAQFSQAQVETLQGRYLSPFLGDFVIEGDTQKLRTAFDGIPVRLKPMNDGEFGIDLRLFGLIPIKNKFTSDLRLNLIKQEGELLIKAVHGPVIAQKVSENKLPDSWKSFLGTYKLANPDPLHIKFGVKSLRMSEADGFIKGELRMKDHTDTYFFEIVGEQRAKAIGYGRGLGGSAWFRKDISGKHSIEYSGLRFVKND